jgi:hypothetical protein
MSKKKTIDNIRKALGTLPSQNSEISYDYYSAFDKEVGNVRLVHTPKNPYKQLVAAATATWGDGQPGEFHGSMNKWEKLTPEARYVVALSVLTGNTLPQAVEPITFQWEFNGFPRHTFDQFARMRIGAAIFSIGSRDNNKLDSPLILYPNLVKEFEANENLKKDFEHWLTITKDLYKTILDTDKGSWQLARAVLPMSYNHSWGCYTNLLALKGQMSRRLMPCEESPIVLMFWKMRKEIENKFPFIANYLRPACDNAKKCIYHGSHEGLTKYFSNLFAGCGRWPDEVDYQEFNQSCTDTNELAKVVDYVLPNEWINYTENDFDKLSNKDKALFIED